MVRARQPWSDWLDRRRTSASPPGSHHTETHLATMADALDLDPDDPLVACLKEIQGTADVAKLDVDSPLTRQLHDRGIVLVVPMVSHGEVVGVLGLGPRRGRQAYSDGDRALLTGLAAQAAPVLRVAQMVRQRQAEAQERERIEQELQVAQLIQQTLLPKTLPELPGWSLAAVYRPARAIGGDFYDFVTLADGRLGIIIADVTSKGVPAALVMATARSVLRTSALQEDTPGNVLGRANELICPDMPTNMFVSCFYAILDPDSGHLSYANAGHPLALRRHDQGVDELRATGLPLGLMPDPRYEEQE
ncbi:MAG TPA: GAF domain-containing SpoIIE family protein phosphatase, partial [Thermomicrobiales bacterium]|nr:GAF domain-containing SpoIIE family protein phosphatase [Thermomicrobiales bacterium]